MTRKIRLTRPGTNPKRDSDRRVETAIKLLRSDQIGSDAADALKAFLDDIRIRKIQKDSAAASLLTTLLKEYFIGQHYDVADKL